MSIIIDDYIAKTKDLYLSNNILFDKSYDSVIYMSNFICIYILINISVSLIIFIKFRFYFNFKNIIFILVNALLMGYIFFGIQIIIGDFIYYTFI